MVSDRIKKISISQTQRVSAEAKKLISSGMDIIDLSAGEPDFPTPQNVKEAAISAIRKNLTKYTLSAGSPDLRKAVAQKLKNENGLSYGINEIIISNGAKQSIFNAIQTLVNPGDEVIIPSPYWVSYPEMVFLASGEPVFIKTSTDSEFKISPLQLKSAVTEKTKALILCNPGNPSGNFYTGEELGALAEVCKNHSFYIISDEIYEKLVYDDQKFTSFAGIPGMKEKTILVNGLSKSHSMTGWRIGYSAGPEMIIRGMDKIQSHSTSNASTVSQAAALEALTGPQNYLSEMLIEFERRRDFISAQFCLIPGVKCNRPKGAFFLFPEISSFFGRGTDVMKISNSFEMAMYLLYQAGVAVVPGSSFGEEGYIRISYVVPIEKLQKAVERIRAALLKLN